MGLKSIHASNFIVSKKMNLSAWFNVNVNNIFTTFLSKGQASGTRILFRYLTPVTVSFPNTTSGIRLFKEIVPQTVNKPSPKVWLYWMFCSQNCSSHLHQWLTLSIITVQMDLGFRPISHNPSIVQSFKRYDFGPIPVSIVYVCGSKPNIFWQSGTQSSRVKTSTFCLSTYSHSNGI